MVDCNGDGSAVSEASQQTDSLLALLAVSGRSQSVFTRTVVNSRAGEGDGRRGWREGREGMEGRREGEGDGRR